MANQVIFKNIYFLMLLLLVILHADFAAFAVEDDGAEVIPLPVEDEIEVMPIDPKLAKALCEKYEGSYIGYYGKVYKIESCLRREMVDSNMLWQLSRKGIRIKAVEGDVIAHLKEGQSMSGSAHRRDCKDFEGKYVTGDHVDMYLVRSCRLYRFPDWESFVSHRRENSRQRDVIMELSGAELASMGQAKDLPSTLDKEFAQSFKIEEIEILPQSIACKGLEGNFVSFHSRLYQIQNCHKRPVDAEAATRKFGSKLNPIELSPQQWISLPEGKDWIL